MSKEFVNGVKTTNSYHSNLSDDQKLVLNVTLEDTAKFTNENLSIFLSVRGPQNEDQSDEMRKYEKKYYNSKNISSDNFSVSSGSSSELNHHVAGTSFQENNLLSPELIRSIDEHRKFKSIDRDSHMPEKLLLDIKSHSLGYDINRKKDETSDEDNDSSYGEVITCGSQPDDSEKIIINYYDDDKYYKFHIHENYSSSKTSSREDLRTIDYNHLNYEEDRDYDSSTSTIRSSKGTIRGVKNRVKNGIATFLQMQNAPIKNYKEKDEGKIILYTTSMGIVRSTFTKCQTIKKILKTLMVKFEERDVFMSQVHQQEIRDRMQTSDIAVPQLFVDGQYIGNADQVERLNEIGELRIMLKPYKCRDSIFTCMVCGGYRMLPCGICGGSKKSVHRNHFTAEFVALKCMNCDEVGLVKCFSCS